MRSIEPIREMNEYQGMRVNLTGRMGSTKTPYSIDFGVGDIIVPSPLSRTLPVLLEGFERPTILTYSLESIISEKLDSIIRFMESNGRMKDFFDILFLATSFEFDGRTIQVAIDETLSKRGTPIEKDSVQVIGRLIGHDAIVNRWEIFCKKILKYELNLDEVIKLIVLFLDPPFQAMVNEDEFNLHNREFSFLNVSFAHGCEYVGGR